MIKKKEIVAIQTLLKYNWFAIMIEVVFDLLILIDLIVLLFSIFDGNHLLIPLSMVYLYVLLCLRAGQLRRWKDNEIASL